MMDLTWILYVIAAIVLFAGGLFAFFLLRGVRRVAALKREAIASALPATARVIEIDQQGAMGSGTRKLLITLTLDVQPDSGEVYRASTRWFVQEIAVPRIQPGEQIAVRINETYPDRIYPAEDWAEFADWQVRMPESSHSGDPA
jgi:hypothetical protein